MALPRSPDELNAAEVQQYLLHLVRERHLARSSVNQYSCAFRFLYGRVLGLYGDEFQIPLAAAPPRLPEIPKARTLLTSASALGLRVSELCALRVDLTSRAPRSRNCWPAPRTRRQRNRPRPERAGSACRRCAP